MSAFRKKLVKLGYDVHFADAPLVLQYQDIPFDYDAPPEGKSAKDDIEIGEGRCLRAWYKITKSDEDKLAESAGQIYPNYYNMSKSVKFLRDRLAEGYEGVIGFSQGGCTLAAMMCCDSIEPLPIKWAICVASCILGGPRHEEALDTECAKMFARPNEVIPTLVVAGLRDTCVTVDQSKELYDRWLYQRGPPMLVHDGGHCVPSKAGVVNQMLEFIQTNQ